MLSLADAMPLENRELPQDFSTRQRKEFLEIATRAKVELNAVIAEGTTTIGERLSDALNLVLMEAAVVTPDELMASIERTERMASDSPCRGPAIVARAWVDNVFRQELLTDAPTALRKHMQIESSNDTAPTHLTVVANTPQVHNLLVCTLCSCYPRSIIGLSPAWYKSRSYRARAVIEPRVVLAEFGTPIAPEVAVRVHDSTADLRYCVLPERPKGTDGWSEPQLAELVTRDSMIGVARIAEVAPSRAENPSEN